MHIQETITAPLSKRRREIRCSNAGEHWISAGLVFLLPFLPFFCRRSSSVGDRSMNLLTSKNNTKSKPALHNHSSLDDRLTDNVCISACDTNRWALFSWLISCLGIAFLR